MYGTKFVEEKKGIIKQIEQESESGALDKRLVDAQGRLADAEERLVESTEGKKALELDSVSIKSAIGEVELRIQKLHQESTIINNTVKSLNETLEKNDSSINKINKEKKYMNEKRKRRRKKERKKKEKGSYG